MLIRQDERFLVAEEEGKHNIPPTMEVYINRKAKNKTRGHYCWCCAKMRPNEKFSGKNHGHHLCNECSKLGSDELKFRQTKRNIEHLIGWSGQIKKKERTALEKYVNYKDKRISDFVKNLLEEDKKRRDQYFFELAGGWQ